mgnify:CR=1 FL=1|tara:strand:+ start:7400 stop:8068 length:669 start_codon:yes stop_codon:yes gene_type:complete
MSKLETTYHNPSSLIPNDWNPNEVDPVNQDKLKKSLEVDGFFKPVLVRDTEDGLEIIGGYHRIQAAVDLGHTEVPCINLGAISDSKAKKIGLKDNYRYGEDDLEKLTDLLSSGFIDAESLTGEMPIDEAELAGFFDHVDLDDIDIDAQLSEDDEDSRIDLTGGISSDKTHQILRFKVPIDDADHISELIAKTKQQQGLTESDQLTNAGDALVYLIRKGGSDA